MTTYTWTDNVMQGGTACNVDKVNDNLMHLKYNAGGLLPTNDLGTVTSNFTLDLNKIDLANITASLTVSLPTTGLLSGVENIVALDFTTANSTYPTINSYITLTGIIAVTNASSAITGTGTLFTTELQVGDNIKIAGVDYKVSAITSATSLTLASVYSGATASGLTTYRKFIRWSDKIGGKAPTAYSTLSGVRNKLIFKSVWENSLLYWEAEYTTFGGVETIFSQPILSANGTLGGDSFAVYASTQYISYYPYYASDNNSSTYFAFNGFPSFYILYNSKALKVSNIEITNFTSGAAILTGTVFGSNDNSIATNPSQGVWYTLTTFSNSTTTEHGVWNIAIPESNREFYKYYKIYVATAQTSVSHICQINLSAVYIAT